MASGLVGFTLRVMSYFASFALRWYFTEERLAERVRVEVSSEGDGIVVNCGEPADARAWIQITNLSSFPVRVEGIEAVLSMGGSVARFTSFVRADLKPLDVRRFFIESSLTDGQVRCIERHHGAARPRLSVKVFFGCRVRDFLKERSIETANVRFLNCKAPNHELESTGSSAGASEPAA